MKGFLCMVLLLCGIMGSASGQRIVVAQDGSGKFRNIQDAINSLDTLSQTERVVFIKNGVYNEKLFITRSYVRLQGESEKGVIIQTSLPRDVWRCANPDDWGAATVNVKGHDLTFENLTILNTYGFTATKDTVVNCVGESGQNSGTKKAYALPREANEPEGSKIVRKNGHQFAMRSFPGAIRLVFKNCTLRAGGGDTVSPWDVEAGMYYFQNCTMEGDVDFYCPRGWAYAEGCRFICHNLNAAIWHDGSNNASCKTVLKDCVFEGDPGFKLGRFHKEAQFYLINCQFAETMADADIYWVTSAPKPLQWGKRVYYYNCHRKGGDFIWHVDNLPTASVSLKQITPEWTFNGKWNPLKNKSRQKN
ncbi:pectinesterase family protein [Cytophagaceae bacterium YF14B1]|uniref:Pectinesterase n=1 Tax=Xanthocytophaga flava TaxID=3048013 RepID=A0AAE3U653_9BACT|nr:pectinesterase family protein [Xanthocytophaga flavus]MDJ1480197.1 pectinesterase family protein [Xanthocytophaga flavus]